MSQSFASLLRNSRLASYDRTLNQVYTTPSKQKKIGNWGLKRNLPTVIRTKYATIQSLDTQEHQTPWESANNQVLFLRRWKENFPHSQKPVARLDDETVNVARMTPADFKKFLQQCVRLEPRFQQLLKQKALQPDQVFEFLKVSFADSPADTPVGPTYSDHQPEVPPPVEGRILNAEKRGHAVGVGGVVAFLPKRHLFGLRNLGDKRVRTFFVESASIDDEGKPRVVLSVVPQQKSELFFMLDFDEYEPTPSKDMYLTKKTSSSYIKDDDQNVQSNPNHDVIMNKIVDLLK